MEDFKRQAAVGQESLTNEFWVDALGVAQPIYSKRLAAPAGTFGNAGATTLAHGIGASLNLSGPFNVRRVTCTNGTVSKDKSFATYSIDVANINIVTTTDLHLYAGEIVIEYCKS